MTKIRTQFAEQEFQGEINNGESLTVPDMSLTVRKLLVNHTRNNFISVHENVGEYFEDEMIPVFDDITDYEAYKKELVDKAKRVESIIKEEKKAAKEKAASEKKQKESPDLPKSGQSDSTSLKQGESPEKPT